MTQRLNPASEPLCSDTSSSQNSCIHETAPGDATVHPADTTSDELQRTLPPESKFKQSKAPMPLGGHTAPTPAHINALPSEILAHIFQFTIGPNLPKNHPRVTLLPQGVLSHVCTHWRRVATASREFWTLIDFHLLETRFDHHLARAKTYAARASPAPLHVRIALSFPFLAQEATAYSGLAEFVTTIAPRIEFFYLYANGRLTGLCHLLLRDCLAAATPGTLSTLMIKVFEVSYNCHSFIESVEGPNTNESLLLDISEERLEAVLLPIRVLRLEGLCPYWTSKAYHGLTELRIHSAGWPLSVTQSQLVDILVNSPELRRLELSLKVTESHLQHGPMVPVPLAELENLAVNLGNDNEGQGPTLERLLQLLAPGPKPFSLTILGGGNLDTQMLNHSVREFLSRTNVQKMYLAGTGTYLVVSGVLHSSPHLRELCLRCLDITRNYTPAGPHANAHRASSPGLVSLSLNYCVIKLDALRQMLASMKIRSLSVWSCSSSDVNGNQDVSEDTLRRALSDLCVVSHAVGPMGIHAERME